MKETCEHILSLTSMRPWPLQWLNLCNNLREVSGVWGSGTEDLDVLSLAGLQLLDLCQVLRDGEGVLGLQSAHPRQCQTGPQCEGRWF